MNKNQLLLVLILMCCSMISTAREVIIYGTVEHPVSRKIRYTVQDSYLSGNEVLYEVDLNQENKYAVTIDLEETGIIKMTYNRKDMWIYLWGGAYIEVNFSNHNFYSSFNYDGDAAMENTYLAKYVEKFGIIDPYDAAAIFPALLVSNDVYDQMLRLSPSDFSKYAAGKQQEERSFDANYPKRHRLNPDFLAFIKARIDYRWASYLLAYTYFGKKNGYEIPDTFSLFLFDLKIVNDKTLHSADYIGFLEEYLKYNYREMKGDTTLPTDKFQLFGEKYELLSKLLTNTPLELMQGRLLRRILKPKYIPFVETYYKDYIDYSLTEYYVYEVKKIYKEAAKFSNNAPAPDFELMGENGKKVRLSDFKGKVIYLSFWASWCQPCIREMNKSVSNRVALQDTNIVFLYISVDRTGDKWGKALEKYAHYRTSRDFHVYGKGRKSEVAKKYRVISLPQYFLVDKDGSFITSFVKASDSSFIPQMLELVNGDQGNFGDK